MFTRRLTLLAALAAWLFVTPGSARAQVVFFGGPGFWGGGGGLFGNPMYRSPYYSTSRPGWGYPGSPFGYGGSPYGYGGSPYGYGGYMTPGLYPGYSSSGSPAPAATSALPYTPGLNLSSLTPADLTGSPTDAWRRYPRQALDTASAPRMRPALSPALGVAPGPGLLQRKLGPAPGEKAPARLEVRVPAANAKIWVQDYPTTRTGKVRQFESPPLSPGRDYTYRIRASWMSGGKEVTREQTATVHAGSQVEVDFTASK